MPFGYAKFAQDTQSIRNSLVHLDALVLNSRFHDHAKISKAMTLVWSAAVMETFWKSYLQELCTRVGKASIYKKRRCVASASIFYFDTLGSMGDGKKIRRWNRAIDFFEGLQQVSGSAVAALPYDGRTIRPEHLDLAWRLFQLPGGEFPSPVHRQELNTLADRRNDVAHGQVSPQDVGGVVTVGDLRRLVTRLEDIVDHSVICATGQWP